MLSSRVFFLFGLTSLIVGCSTYYKPGDTFYWHGKDDIEFFERKRYPDTTVRCVKDNQVSYIHGYRLALYDLQTYEVGRNAHTIFMTTQKRYTGGYDWTYVFTDADHKITSIRSATGFGDIEKEFKCGGYEENLTHSATKNDKTTKTTDEKIPDMQSRVWMGVARVKGDERNIWSGNATHQYPQDAKDEAIQQCQQMTGEQCEFALGFSNACLSLAHGTRNGRSIDQFGVGFVAEQSKQLALESCQKEGGSDCTVGAPWPICSTPCDPLTDDKCFFAEPQLAKPNKQGKNERISFTYEGGTLPLK